MTTGGAAAPANPYHHGDLAEALVAAALELARAGGPAAVSLREVTRAVGVSPNAAYRHFADLRALVTAAAGRARQQVALTMDTHIVEAISGKVGAEAAVARLCAVGLGYIDFARREPGLFQLAVTAHDRFDDGAGPAAGEEDGAPPFRLLLAALDQLVVAGVLDPARRENAEWACWGAVHGLSDLATRGPLVAADDDVVQALATLVVTRAIEGVIGRPLP